MTTHPRITISPTSPAEISLSFSSKIFISPCGEGLPMLSILLLPNGVTTFGGQVSVIPQPFKKCALGQYWWNRLKISGELGAPKTTIHRNDERLKRSISFKDKNAVYIAGTM